LAFSWKKSEARVRVPDHDENAAKAVAAAARGLPFPKVGDPGTHQDKSGLPLSRGQEMQSHRQYRAEVKGDSIKTLEKTAERSRRI